MPTQRLPRTRAAVVSDRGSAPIEFIFASVVLLIPLVYLVLSLGQVQAGSYATQTTAINAARAAARYPDSAGARAEAMARLHFEDFGVEDARWAISLECSGPCDEAGSTVTAHVETRVPVLGLPALFGRDSAPHVTVRAAHSDIVSPYTASPNAASPNAASPNTESPNAGSPSAGFAKAGFANAGSPSSVDADR